MSLPVSLIALHGFMGLPEDWSSCKIDHEFIAPNLNHLNPHLGFSDWAHHINKIAESSERPPVLLGYSFGGRLALHALIQSPKLWKAAIIVSCHPGLLTKDEKQQRLVEDRGWAKRLIDEPWDELQKNWNQRSVFEPSGFYFQRKESDFSRDHLSQIMVAGSLAKQENLRNPIQKLTMPILWMVGEKDSKYKQLGLDLKFSNGLSRLCEVPCAGHRLPWENPIIFNSLLNQFLEIVCAHDL